MSASRIYRGTWVSPIVWTIVIVVIFAAPLMLLVEWLVRLAFSASDTVSITIGFCCPILLLVCCWVYHRTLQVKIADGELIKSSYFGSRRVSLNAATTFRYKLAKSGLYGVTLSTSDSFSEIDTNFHITIRNGSQKLHVGSAIKGIRELFTFFSAFERDVVLPSILQELSNGATVEFSPFIFSEGFVEYKAHRYPLPQAAPITLKDDRWTTRLGSKKVKVYMSKLANPFVVIALISGDHARR